MTHLRCVDCGVVTCSADADAGGCPGCGAAWPQHAQAIARTDDPGARLDALLALTRELVGADLALLTEVKEGREIVRRGAGAWPDDTFAVGAASLLRDTLCSRMLEGAIDHHIGDVRGDKRVADLGLGERFGIGAWIGVPIRLSDAELYVLCCLAQEMRPGLGRREVTILRGLAESVGAELRAAHPS